MVESETISVSAPGRIPPSPRYNGRLTSDERRRAIIDAARQEFARVGFQGASTSRIAQLADCSEPMLYKHFRSKHSLFVATLRDSIGHYQEWFDETIGADHASDVTELAHELVQVQMREPEFLELLRMRMLAVALQDDADVREAIVELDRATHERIAGLVERAVRQGQVRPDTDPAYVAWTWLGLMLAACYREAFEPGTFDSMAGNIGRLIESLAP